MLFFTVLVSIYFFVRCESFTYYVLSYDDTVCSTLETIEEVFEESCYYYGMGSKKYVCAEDGSVEIYEHVNSTDCSDSDPTLDYTLSSTCSSISGNIFDCKYSVSREADYTEYDKEYDCLLKQTPKKRLWFTENGHEFGVECVMYGNDTFTGSYKLHCINDTFGRYKLYSDIECEDYLNQYRGESVIYGTCQETGSMWKKWIWRNGKCEGSEVVNHGQIKNFCYFLIVVITLLII